jgi:RNA polymerase sigma factor (TIGR02999 family)
MDGRSTITQILLSSGAPAEAMERILPLLYDELRRIAVSKLRRLRQGHSLQPTELVHQAYIRLFDSAHLGWSHRQHFMASVAVAMRHILIDRARRKAAGKRVTPDPLDSVVLSAAVAPEKNLDLLAVDEALSDLAKVSERQAKVIELYYFGGLTRPEVAEVLELSESTVARDWRVGKLWLKRRMSEGHQELAATD